MRVGSERAGRAEGETLVFDDTWEHQVWNHTDETRVVLLIQFEQPVRAPGRWASDRFLRGIRRSFVREARNDFEQWDGAMRRVEKAHALDG